MKFIKTLSLTVVCIILGVMLAMQYKTIGVSQDLIGDEYQRLEDVKNQLLTEIRKNEELREKNKELNEQIEKFQSASSNESQKIEMLNSELEKLRIFSGFTDVKGSGVRVFLERGEHEYSSIRDTDILKLVNELKATGAQAISVNDQRILAMTEIRKAGNYIIINGIQTAEPYRITAISDKDKLEAALTMTGGIIKELELYMDVKIEKADDIIIREVDDKDLIFDTSLLDRIVE